MSAVLRLGELEVDFTRKAVKHVHLSVHPPEGRVSLVAPVETRIEVARAYVLSRLTWIRQQQASFRSQARESPSRYVGRESHYLWGRRYFLELHAQDGRGRVELDHRRIRLFVPGESTREDRARILHDWHKRLLHVAIPPMIKQWERRLGVEVRRYFLQRMKTKWGSCNAKARHIRLNTELVKKPKELLEYVVLHEMVHLIEPTHGERFVQLLEEHWPNWREARLELNELPLGFADW